MTVGELATGVEVDPKTVERWLQNGRVPHKRHRQRVASLLESDEIFLWPQLLDDEQVHATSKAELMGFYPNRGAVPADLWRRLVDGATERVEILVYAGLFLVDSHPDLPAKLVERAADGLKVRLLYGDPDSATVAWRGDEEGIGANLAARIRLSLTYMQPVLGIPGVEVRQHDSVLYNSIYRFDDQMLVNTHVVGSPAPQNPVLHIRKLADGQLFEHYLKSFDRVWDAAQALDADSLAQPF
ncbi:XRE family transcriptional regulator [Nocardioides immobilis]|uniref:XRE family transcriptional regulator n=1 Tax=Nocardioides immobilis TaxID=2049295 RepID=UPI001C715067|nr:XRE family transcriptional regulator [Nocardioides immobilis]